VLLLREADVDRPLDGGCGCGDGMDPDDDTDVGIAAAAAEACAWCSLVRAS
jgi:hypothetical protein